MSDNGNQRLPEPTEEMIKRWRIEQDEAMRHYWADINRSLVIYQRELDEAHREWVKDERKRALRDDAAP